MPSRNPRLTIRLFPSEWKTLKRIAEKAHTTPHRAARRYLRAWLKRQKK